MHKRMHFQPIALGTLLSLILAGACDLAPVSNAAEGPSGSTNQPRFEPGTALPSETEIQDRRAELIQWAREIEQRVESFQKERPGERGVLRTRLEMNLALIYLELAHWTIGTDGETGLERTPRQLIGSADDLVAEVDEDLLSESDERVLRELRALRSRVTLRQIDVLTKELDKLKSPPRPSHQATCCTTSRLCRRPLIRRTRRGPCRW